ncbi:molybdopterin molybdotransferase MoeA [Synechococcus sp. CS-1328]|uniref:molybdopterin molybdotransferase MoeA n=1 Tax=Synechococcus sp. CS-1328 TaxID=2847976 RepID=UPI00223B8D15|nr:molybdopterin molybdotransferase MoeA [Synechococcus sp. CS-1328]MCT0224337.1 molybdopterin molybdotransferase MoeA [Synechococcus sp. CS-1328]
MSSALPAGVPVSADPFPPEGLPLEQARCLVLASLQPLAGCRTLPLEQCLGRVCAAAVIAPAAVPGFRASILDGYAIASPTAEPGQCWPLVGRSAAGAPFERTLEPHEAIRILTGAPLPEGAVRVLPQELVEVEAGELRLLQATGANPWIRSAEEEAAPGQELLACGERLGPADLARLAGCGVAELAVAPRPRLGLLVSGDELVPAGTPRGPGQIWESNGTLLACLCERLGYPLLERRVVGDDPIALRQALADLAACCDVVVSTGGVSAGDTDWIRPLLAELGSVAFWKLFLKPGRPFAYGTLQRPAGAGSVPFFGLPGNPVAAAITALQLLWPALQQLEGAEPDPLPRLRVRLAGPLKRGAGRPELARARLRVGPAGELLAMTEGSQASSRIGSLQGADLLLEIPAELGSLGAGQELWAQLLRLPLF